MSMFMRLAVSIGMVVLSLTSVTGVVLFMWLPAESWDNAAAAVTLFNFLSAALLFLAQRYGYHIPGKLFLGRLMLTAFIWQLLFDVLGISFGLLRLAVQILTGWTDGLKSGAEYLAAAAGALGFYSVFIEPCLLDSSHFEIPVPGLAKEMDGYTIAQLSDVHLGAFVPVSRLRRLLEAAVRQRPEVLVITGDLFDSPQNAVNDEAARLLDSFADRFPDGIYYVWGNHEYYRDTEAIAKSLSRTKIHELRNSCRLVHQGVPPLYFAGVDYPFTQGVVHVRAPQYVEQACRKVPSGAVLVMLAHHPDFFDDAAAAGAVLTLSGHTHGGQIGFLGHALIPSVFNYVRGMYQKAGHYCYVHKGSGGRFPYRLGCMPELACFTLKVCQQSG